MITLEDFIEIVNEDYIDNCLLYHILIECSSAIPIFESRGLVDGAMAIAKEIADKIDNREYDIKLNNTFVKSIKLSVVHNSSRVLQCSYKSNKSQYNSEENIFDTVYIHCNIPEVSISKYLYVFIKQLCHELTHVYEDYCRNIKNASAKLIYLYSDKYQKAVSLQTSNNSNTKLAADFIYYTNETERNAYNSEIFALLKQHFKGDNQDRIKECFYIIRNEEFYKCFRKAGNIINLINHNKLLIDNDPFVEEYKKIANCKSNSEAFKNIKAIYNTWKEKLTTLIPKVICDFIAKLDNEIAKLGNNTEIINFDKIIEKL